MDSYTCDERQRFLSLLSATVSDMNNQADVNADFFRQNGGTRLEPVVVSALRANAAAHGFCDTDIRLVSGARFPDIIIGSHFGIEVKTTKDDSWKSIGSSIVESTRIESVKEIFLLFGKLGGRVGFACAPYEACMSGIAVTHLPRYQIDMELCRHTQPTIFERLNIPYDRFCRLDETEKVKAVRSFYKRLGKEQGREVMPWWIGEDTSTKMNLVNYSSLSAAEKNRLRARGFVLFPSLFNSMGYDRIAFWLCNRYSIINHNVRDGFSAGGQVGQIGSVIFSPPIPKIIQVFHTLSPEVIYLLNHPDKELLDDISDYWGFPYDPANLFGAWAAQVNRIFALRRFRFTIETIIAIPH